MRGKRMHKGRTRRFTAPEEIDRQLELSKGEAQSSLRKTIHEKNIEETTETETDDDDDEEEEDDDDDDDDNSNERHKGVSHLIEVCNPNHVKSSKTVIPSRKEIAASVKATTDPIKLLSETELAANIARLQLVRKERELAAKKLEQEKQAREAQRAASAAATAKRTSHSKPQQKVAGGGGRSVKQQHANSNKHHQNNSNTKSSSADDDDN